MRILLSIITTISLLISACTLSSPPATDSELTSIPTAIVAEQPTRTPISSASANTVTPNTQASLPSNITTTNNGTVICNQETSWTTYTIAAGDTLFDIAQRSNSTVDTLVSANCLVDAGVISVGQVLYVPNPVQSRVPIEYWVGSETNASADAIPVGCDGYLMPIVTDDFVGGDVSQNIKVALTNLFNPNPTLSPAYMNFLAPQNLTVDSVVVTNGDAVVNLGGGLMGVGVCALPILQGQILHTIFQFEEVQTVKVMNGYKNLAEVMDQIGLEDLSGYVYMRSDLP